MHRDKKQHPQPPRSVEGDLIVVEERRRCGWGAVLAAVVLFATLLLTVPAGPATAVMGGAVYDASGGASLTC
jgi:hypothetical protein